MLTAREPGFLRALLATLLLTTASAGAQNRTSLEAPPVRTDPPPPASINTAQASANATAVAPVGGDATPRTTAPEDVPARAIPASTPSHTTVTRSGVRFEVRGAAVPAGRRYALRIAVIAAAADGAEHDLSTLQLECGGTLGSSGLGARRVRTSVWLAYGPTPSRSRVS